VNWVSSDGLHPADMRSRFSTHPMFANIAPMARSKQYYDESAKLLDIRDTSVVTIQACIILGGIATTNDDATTESVYYTVACRMANLMDLAHRSVTYPLEREVNIRSACIFLNYMRWCDADTGQYGGRYAWSTFGLPKASVYLVR